MPTRSRAESKIEAQVRAFLNEQGHPMARHRVGVLVLSHRHLRFGSTIRICRDPRSSPGVVTC